MFRQPKCCRLEAVYSVAGCALTPVDALGELAMMRIRPVTIHALLKGYWLLEISRFVALHTTHFSVLAEKRKFGLGVVEVLVQCGRRNLLPTQSAVAGLAGLAEPAAMGIRMTVLATAKCYSRVAWPFVSSGSVALLATDIAMQAGERIAGLGMVELTDTDAFPVVVVVTLQTIGSELSFVLILMAGGATRRNSQECFAEILDFDGGALTLADMLGSVALTARQSCVLAFERISSFSVIESPGIPLNQDEVFTVMLGVASRAFHARTRIDVERGVQSLSRGDARRNFRVAIQTLERRRSSGNFVARSAVRHATERAVRTGERAWRNLRRRRN